MALTDEDVREILRIIDENDLDELRVETEGFSLYVRRAAAGSSRPPGLPPSADASSTPPELTQRGREDAPAPQPQTPEPPPTPDLPAEPPADGLVEIPSPMLGTFYRAQEPGAPPFVDPGSRVEPDTIVCIIEVMKMMNSIPAGVSGTIVEVCSENAELVEYGQPLFRVQPG